MATLFNTKIKDTYQSLLKLEDNTILTTTTKNVTDGLGNASPLYMSTTQVRIGSTSGSAMYWDNVNNRLGIGTATPLKNLVVEGSTSSTIRIAAPLGTGGETTKLEFNVNSGIWTSTIAVYQGGGGVEQDFRFYPGGATTLTLFSSGNSSFGTTSSLGAKVGIKGSGSTSATTSLLVQNSSATTALSILDDRSSNFNGTVNINTGITGGSYLLYVRSAFVGQELFTVQENQNMVLGCNNVVIRANATWNSQGQSGLAFNANNWYPQGDTRIGWSFTGNMFGATGGNSNLSLIRVNPSLGNFNSGTTSEVNCLLFNPAINQVNTGTYIVRGIYYNPTLTSLTSTTHTAIETVTGNVLLGTTSGNVGIGTSTPGNRLSVNGLSDFTLVGNNNHGKIVRVQNTDSTNTTFGLGIETYSDGTGNRSVDLVPYNHTGANLAGTWSINTLVVVSDLRNNYWSDFNIYHWNSNAGQAIKFHSLGPSGSGGVIVQFVNNGNVQIGTTTDAGYKLDVNGSTRVKGNSLTLSASGLTSPPANYVALNFDDSPNHHEYWYAINSKKDLYGTIGVGYDRIIFPTMGNDSSTWEFNALGSYSRIQVSARNNTAGNYLNLTNSSIVFCGPWTVASIDRTNRKLVFGNMTTDVHHIAVYDILIKGAQPFESNTGGSIANGGNVYVVGGTPSTSPAGNYGNVLLAHDGTSARGNVGVGEASPTARLQVKGSGSTSATTSLLIQNSAGTLALQVLDDSRVVLGNASDFAVYSGSAITQRFAMSVGTTSLPVASAVLEVVSTTQGFLPPRMLQTQRTAITSPAIGLMVYQTDMVEGLYIYKSTGWTFII